MKKLVRDKIPEFAKEASYRYLTHDEIEPALKKKLVEETSEVVNATSETNLVEELGDVYEVLRAYLDFKGIDQEHFLKVVAQKRAEKGGFTEFIEMEAKKFG
ncbi:MULTISPECIES: nucleoside triphosphate pyrophosphohydrolase [unclassified Lactobacillus]|uniref:nucleoside triphosphate pyrophosphohydrolase n=1 Tax=unclassified Lactobacillus TaxID=2620435 RepID=UPI000EFAC4D7|nr:MULTISPECIES: nucleoside triphosphate pyrophosphohydrolase [unclassified Lactobacillus]RMC24147.1 phosphoribosyl-ATP pyrophosphohydrolase [Lactobacillus sp. ESL0247]RMC28720.1 phosphoribosyl-ATP pyrophosphohydrolase [Lactobacillus sp. ESL0246]RMC31377.1 phosphoribosyl-ATP pyrophosphohydrolase [Lactobacillus sp. ESL0245]RMC49048.1 phosphoribosyl-ATP pyrophosphohydrolase [Lactobacillus sp. ESL0228]